MKNNNLKTYADYKAAGYTDADLQWTRGYVSRKCNQDEQPVEVAGGRRKGDLYVLLPSWQSTTYCLRQYLKAPQEAH